MAWYKQQHAIDSADVDRNFASHKNTLIIDMIYQNNKKNLSRFPPKLYF